MKRLLFIIWSLMAIAISTNAQVLVEVRGVETKPHSEFAGYSNVGYYCYDKGFVFTNQNSFPVSVEATYYVDGVEKDSKSFELDSQESYFWKVFLDSCSYSKVKPSYADTLLRGYVKYRAFKTTAVITE